MFYVSKLNDTECKNFSRTLEEYGIKYRPEGTWQFFETLPWDWTPPVIKEDAASIWFIYKLEFGMGGFGTTTRSVPIYAFLDEDEAKSKLETLKEQQSENFSIYSIKAVREGCVL
jgi:hypothetical protein